MHRDKCFVTLTYDDAHLPAGRSLDKTHWQKFIRALRKATNAKIRYFACGEYGDKDQRPHYHALLFGIDFPDKKFHSRNGRGETIYKSKRLEEIWGKGFCTIGAVTFESAAYTARYVLKKVNGENASKHYETLDLATGELFERQREFILASLKPGIGGKWYERFKSDVYPSDFHVLRGKRMRPAKFYDRQLEKAEPLSLEALKFERKRSASKHKADQTPERLAVKQEVKLSQLKSLKRKL